MDDGIHRVVRSFVSDTEEVNWVGRLQTVEHRINDATPVTEWNPATRPYPGRLVGLCHVVTPVCVDNCVLQIVRKTTGYSHYAITGAKTAVCNSCVDLAKKARQFRSKCRFGLLDRRIITRRRWPKAPVDDITANRVDAKVISKSSQNVARHRQLSTGDTASLAASHIYCHAHASGNHPAKPAFRGPARAFDAPAGLFGEEARKRAAVLGAGSLGYDGGGGTGWTFLLRTASVSSVPTESSHTARAAMLGQFRRRSPP